MPGQMPAETKDMEINHRAGIPKQNTVTQIYNTFLEMKGDFTSMVANEEFNLQSQGELWTIHGLFDVH